MIGRSTFIRAALAAALLALCGHAQFASAVDVLLNGGLEDSTGPLNWTLTQSVTVGASGDYNGNGVVDSADYVVWRNGGPLLNEVPETTPGTVTPEDYDAWRGRFGNGGGASNPIGAIEHLDGANQPMPADGELGLLVRPFQGNIGDYENQNGRVNFSMSRVYNGVVVGRTYTFSGWSYFQVAASNNVTTLFADSPSGAAASPTQTYFELQFLNASDQAVGSPTRFDLPRNRPTDTLPADWLESSVMAAAPTGATKLRMTVAATDMVASCTTACPGGQDVFFDNFSLRDSFLPTIDRINDTGTPPLNGNLNFPGAPKDWVLQKTSQDNVQFSNASYAKHTGNVGMWIRAFSGGDVKILQTVAATAGQQYTFSGWSKWELGYIGGDPQNTTNTTFMLMEFLDSPTATTPLSSVNLNLRTLQMNDDTWRQFATAATTAPAGTTHIRVSAGATNLGNSGFNPQSAMFDDFALIQAGSGAGNLLGDFVPEPTSLWLMIVGMSAMLSYRRR